MGVHKVSAFHPFTFQKSEKSTIIRNLAVPRHFVAYLVFISSIRVDPGPRNRGITSLIALKIRTPVANTGKLRSIGQVPVCFDWFKKLRLFSFVLNLKIDVVLKASRAVVIRRFSLNEAPLGLFKFISDYLPYFEKINIFFNIIAKKV
jgi:hypothetical protein